MYGSVGTVSIAGVPTAANQAILGISPGDRLDAVYLWFFLRHRSSDLARLGRGGTQSNINAPIVRDLRLPLPPVDEQRRIAAQLTDQLAAIERARQATTDRMTTVAALRATIYERAFRSITPLASGRTADAPPSGWRWTVLTDLARLESGHTPSRGRPDWWGGDVAWIALPDIRAVDGRVITETMETTNAEGIAHSSARILPIATVVLSRTASVGFVARMGRPMATSQDFVNWVCGPDLDPEFLMHLLIRSRDYVRSLSSGAVHKTVYVPTVKAFQVCVPEIDEQRRIAAELRERLATIDTMAKSIEAEREAIEALPAALLREAFGSAQ
jgi:type I restriction enzyme S subunit